MSWLERRVPPPIVAIVMALAIWLLAREFPMLRTTSLTQTLLAAALALSGVAIDLAAIRAFRRAQTTVNPLRPDAATELVTSGVFRVSRNPMYVGLVLILSGVALHMGSWFGPLLILGLVLYLTRFQIVPEERAMQALFGDAFDRYAAQVRRWL
ncbi:MAG: isoprenylcysteine carboxylmethyltransferase family protein [Pseudomonadota bacterium]